MLICNNFMQTTIGNFDIKVYRVKKWWSSFITRNYYQLKDDVDKKHFIIDISW